VARLVSVLAAVAAVLLVAGCGSDGVPESGNTSNGKALFTGEGQCASCHTLADAGARGQIGPNLDEAFVQSRKDGIGEETIAGIIRNQIAYPVEDPSTGAPGMPANLVTGQDADDVALYVATVAGMAQAEAGGGQTTTGGGSSGGGAADGESVFASAGCGTCHAFADAGSTGTVGPNLDDAMPSKELAIDRVTNGSGAMPPFKDQLSEAEIEAVAEYVAGG
jgi:cbb3-type cytochrome c oxidase subunit III